MVMQQLCYRRNNKDAQEWLHASESRRYINLQLYATPSLKKEEFQLMGERLTRDASNQNPKITARDFNA